MVSAAQLSQQVRTKKWSLITRLWHLCKSYYESSIQFPWGNISHVGRLRHVARILILTGIRRLEDLFQYCRCRDCQYFRSGGLDTIYQPFALVLAALSIARLRFGIYDSGHIPAFLWKSSLIRANAAPCVLKRSAPVVRKIFARFLLVVMMSVERPKGVSASYAFLPCVGEQDR